MTTWPVYVALNAVTLLPQEVSYATCTLVLMELTVEHVRPVVRPLLETAIPRVAVASVDEGGAAAMLVELDGPRSRIVPARSTVPGMIWAMADRKSTRL